MDCCLRCGDGGIQGDSVQVETSNKIKNMGFMCALLVVMQHIPQSEWIVRMGALTQIAVPFFFVISGYFFVKDANQKKWWTKAVAKRLRTLLIPYLVICLSWFGLMALVHGKASGLIAALGLNLCAWPAVAPMWYVRALLLYMVAAPAVYLFVAESKLRAGFVLILLGCVAIVANCIAFTTDNVSLMWFLRWGINFGGFFWFVLGMAIRRWCKEFVIPKCVRVCAGGALVIICAVANGGFPDGATGAVARFVTTPIVMAGVWFVMSSRGFPAVLGRNAFAIYVIHWQLSHIMHAITKSEIAIVYLVVCVLGSILIAEAFRKLTPRFANVVLGGR